ncbi:Monooxygenase, FAD-binding [Lasallia pustulata]|uniref:Monooxygenase, FAD-binding n=1 Tax=Lasallia pustulata TaxID=136370 RepID=A0A1W5D9F8_9LECA|nr:Monooxygenase, FAD-binding [Lasallia pustulata]
MDKPLDVVIVGGSLAGLMSGVVLKRLGHNVRILNRDPSSSLQGQGAGISALQNVQEYLATYDVTKKPHSVLSKEVQFLNKEGEITKTTDWPMWMTSWNVLYYRLRANFDGLLSEYCPELPKEAGSGEGKAIYSPGKNVTDVKYADGMVTVYFDNHEGGSGSLHADLVLAADGPASKIRQILEPDLQRTYAGYVAWRGTAPESDMSEETRKAFGGKISYYQCTNPRGHILMYTIPGQNGTLEPGQRLLNYVWYCNHAAESPALAALLTDSDGHRHRITLPMGKMRPDIWAAQKDFATQTLPPPFAELVHKTSLPFVQAITDVASPNAAFFDGKLLLVGDSLTAFRPHVAASTGQAALHAQLLDRMLRGEIGVVEWEREALRFSRLMRLRSMLWGNTMQYGYLAGAVSYFWYAREVAAQWVGRWWYG